MLNLRGMDVRRKKLAKVFANEYYENYYPLILGGGSIGAAAAWTHRSLEHIPQHWPDRFEKVIEIGAGNGEHLSYVNHNFNSYLETDVRIEVLATGTKNREIDSRVIQEALDANQLSTVTSDSFDRLIATCVLIHLENPDQVLSEIRRILKSGGVASLYVPCEPGLMLRFIRYWTTARKGRRLGVDHLFFHYYEHRFHVLYLQSAVRHVFESDEVIMTRHPFKFFSWNFNLWQTYQIRVKKS